MASSCRIGVLLRPGSWAALLLLPAALMAADRASRKPLPAGEPVEVFSGIEKGQIEVRLIPRDSTKANLMIRNKTDKPLNVVLPHAFAGVPVLAQIPNGLIGNNRIGNDRRAPQMLGVGPGGNNPWGPGQRNLGIPNPGGPNLPPGFLFNVAPEKVGKLKLTGVCLEHGKPNPRPKFKYQIKPIRSVTDKSGVAELCEMLGRGEIGQRVAQLAAWHLNNDLSWQRLANMRTSSRVASRPIYTSQELLAGKKAAEMATKLAEKNRKATARKAISSSRG